MAAAALDNRAPENSRPRNGIFDFELDQELFEDNPASDENRPPVNSRRSDLLGVDDTLGLDEEVKVVKKRAPRPKLDENLLLSAGGIPKLRRTVKKLRFHGKKNEHLQFQDLAKLLEVYQLWLDDLFPREKFADALRDVEKAGHNKRLQVMRKEWISECNAVTMGFLDEPRSNDHHEMASSPQAQSGAAASIEAGLTGAGEDEGLFVSNGDQSEDQTAPDFDELDAILAEDEARRCHQPNPSNASKSTANPVQPSFDDDEEALAALEGFG